MKPESPGSTNVLKDDTPGTSDRPGSPPDPTAPEEHRRHHWWKWALGAVVVVAVFAVAAPYVYIHFLQGTPPDKLSLGGVGTNTAAGPASLDGRWQVGRGSTAGWRLDEILLGQSTTAVGRTNDVTGTFTLDGSTVTNGSFTVNLATVTSTHGLHDSAFRKLLDTQNQPTSTFVMTAPIELGSVPSEGKIIKVTAAGNLTVKGTTKPVEFPLQVRRAAGTVDVLGTLPVHYPDFGIDNPTNAAASVGDVVTIEFLLRFAKAVDTATTTTSVPPTTTPTLPGPIVVPPTTPPLGL
jgi:polyisoprenoid-binding protein YceI